MRVCAWLVSFCAVGGGWVVVGSFAWLAVRFIDDVDDGVAAAVVVAALAAGWQC